MGGGGNVDIGSSALVSIMESGSLLPEHERRIRRLVIGSPATINQKLMAWAAGLWSSQPDIVKASIAGLRTILGDELKFGPKWKEVGCPDSHDGMYWLGWVGVVAAGLRSNASPEIRELGTWAETIIGQMLRLGDLIATPDGDCRGLWGMRAPAGAELGRRAHSNVYRLTCGLPSRGPGGNKMTLKWKEDSDPLVDGAAWWVKLILESPVGPDLLRGPWSTHAPLPARLRLPGTFIRFEGGTLSYCDSPQIEQRASFLTHGSASAKREGKPEPMVDWIQVIWREPGKHVVTAGLNWETQRPDVSDRNILLNVHIPGI